MARPAAIELMDTLERVKVPSFIVGTNGAIAWLNGSAKEMFGDLTGKPFTAVVVPDDVPLVQRQLDRKLRGAAVTDYHVNVVTRDGRVRRGEVSSVPIKGGDRCHAIFGVVIPGPAGAGTVRRVGLTARQTEVLQLLGEGASTEQMAAALHLSRETVRNHVRHVLRALGAHSRLEAVAIAHREGLLATA
jgi:PAS domain S-box-containing protein